MNMLNYTAFGQRIRRYRKLKNMTQEELSDAVSISISFLGHIERGTRKASMETMIRISSALGITPNELLTDSITEHRNLLYNIPKPADHFAVIRRELDLLEVECKGTKLT